MIAAAFLRLLDARAMPAHLRACLVAAALAACALPRADALVDCNADPLIIDVGETCFFNGTATPTLIRNSGIFVNGTLRVAGALTIAAPTVVVNATGVITAAGLGYNATEGPGSCGGFPILAGGAHAAFTVSYWGVRPNYLYPYGSTVAPTTQGSGGCYVSGVHSRAGAGGGSLTFVVSGTMRVRGVIDVSGAPPAAPRNGQGWGGGGAGGSIYIVASRLDVPPDGPPGKLLARGGQGRDPSANMTGVLPVPAPGSGGSGGRISLSCTTAGARFDATKPALWPLSIDASAGCADVSGSPTHACAGGGTVYVQCAVGVVDESGRPAAQKGKPLMGTGTTYTTGLLLPPVLLIDGGVPLQAPATLQPSSTTVFATAVTGLPYNFNVSALLLRNGNRRAGGVRPQLNFGMPDDVTSDRVPFNVVGGCIVALTPDPTMNVVELVGKAFLRLSAASLVEPSVGLPRCASNVTIINDPQDYGYAAVTRTVYSQFATGTGGGMYVTTLEGVTIDMSLGMRISTPVGWLQLPPVLRLYSSTLTFLGTLLPSNDPEWSTMGSATGTEAGGTVYSMPGVVGPEIYPSIIMQSSPDVLAATGGSVNSLRLLTGEQGPVEPQLAPHGRARPTVQLTPPNPCVLQAPTRA